MTLDELENPLTYISTTDGTVYNIVFVLNHKTFATHGPLPVPFGEIAWIHLHNYFNLSSAEASFNSDKAHARGQS